MQQIVLTDFPEEKIRDLHTQFRSMKRYLDRLAFYDRHFGIVPFSFPAFDPELPYFFERDKTEALVDLMKKERNNPDLSERTFRFDETYRFSIKPINSNNPLYSTYILCKFLMALPGPDDRLENPLLRQDTKLLDDGNRIINFIEYKLQNEYDKSPKIHYMTVFYRGFSDAFLQKVRLPDKKRKFIELYLYSQGILYAKYLAILKSRVIPRRKTGRTAAAPGFSNGLGLLNELGAIDLLQRKYAVTPTPESSSAFAAIILQISLAMHAHEEKDGGDNHEPVSG